jgi:glycosyltransferase involved in cell wall biosynthesis
MNTAAHQDVRYVIITPVRDEQQYLPSTIESVMTQTILPVEWVIVNDGSTDRTRDIIDDFAARIPWIHAVHRPNRGFRQAGGGVVGAFYGGYHALQCKDWDFIVKLDGDLSFEPGYFQKCLEAFQTEQTLGIAGGEIYHDIDGKLELEATPRFHVRGATKIYRRACWDVIGGLWPAPGWDTIDEVKANMLGWRTRSLDHVRLLHHRFTGSVDGSWRDAGKYGKVCYISGYHPLFVLASCIYRLKKKPYVIGSVAVCYEFVKSHFVRLTRVDNEVMHFVRSQQLRRLFGRETIWK